MGSVVVDSRKDRGMKHDNAKYGSMATPCDRCNLEFTFQITHQGWIGLPCKAEGYSTSERIKITQQYIQVVAISANTRQAVREHYLSETGTPATF